MKKLVKILRKNQSENEITKAPILSMDDRDFGIGAQILHDLDITNLISNLLREGGDLNYQSFLTCIDMILRQEPINIKSFNM